MANLLRSLTQPRSTAAPTITLDQWAQYFGYQGLDYGYVPGQTLIGDREEIGGDFRGFIEGAYKSNGIVFACILSRLMVFSEARFQFRQRRSGRPGDLFGTDELKVLESPWRNATTGDLLTRMIQDADLAGNFYAYRQSRTRLVRLRPDWVTIVIGSESGGDAEAGDLDAEVVGYLYHPGGRHSDRDPVMLLREQVAHFAPIPDPAASFRGMSWLSPVVREIMSDNAATNHKLSFFEAAATPNMIVKVDPEIRQPEAYRRWVDAMEMQHAGIGNAYRTMYLGGGADAQVVGADMKQMDFKVVQGAGETRIAAAAGVPPIMVGLSEGLEAATYSNYAQAVRRFADGTVRPLWRNAAGSLSSVIRVPAGAELWYDDRDIPFLQEDLKDAAQIQQTQAITIRELINAGYEPQTVVDAVEAGDFKRLKHTGLVSVQLQPPGADVDGDGEPDDTSPDVVEPAARAAQGRRLLERHVNGGGR